MSDISSDPQFTAFLDDIEASRAWNSNSYSDITVRSVHTWQTLMKILLTVTEIQVCLIKMWTGLMAVCHHGGLGLHCSVDLVCLFHIIITARPWALSAQSPTGHDQVPPLFLCCDTYLIQKNTTLNCSIIKLSFKGGSPTTLRQVSLKSGHILMHISVGFHDQGELLQVNTGIVLQMTGRHHNDTHTNTEQTSITSPLCHKIWCFSDEYFFFFFFFLKHSNPIFPVVLEKNLLELGEVLLWRILVLWVKMN